MKRIVSLALLIILLSAVGVWAVATLDATKPANNALFSTIPGYMREDRAKINEIIGEVPDVKDFTVISGDYTAVNGDRLAVNTTGRTITVTLPASPTAGNFVWMFDAKGTWPAYAVTVARNGSNINFLASNYSLTASGLKLFVYVDSNVGWMPSDATISGVVQAFYPEWYGGVGNGVTDDTAAITAAYDAAVAAGGETIYLSCRNWKFNLEILSSGITIRGCARGYETDTYRPPGGAGSNGGHPWKAADTTKPILTIGDETVKMKYSGITIRDVYLDGWDNNATIGIWVRNASDFLLENFTISGFSKRGLVVGDANATTTGEDDDIFDMDSIAIRHGTIFTGHQAHYPERVAGIEVTSDTNMAVNFATFDGIEIWGGQGERCTSGWTSGLCTAIYVRGASGVWSKTYVGHPQALLLQSEGSGLPGFWCHGCYFESALSGADPNPYLNAYGVIAEDSRQLYGQSWYQGNPIKYLRGDMCITGYFKGYDRTYLLDPGGCLYMSLMGKQPTFWNTKNYGWLGFIDRGGDWDNMWSSTEDTGNDYTPYRGIFAQDDNGSLVIHNRLYDIDLEPNWRDGYRVYSRNSYSRSGFTAMDDNESGTQTHAITAYTPVGYAALYAIAQAGSGSGVPVYAVNQADYIAIYGETTTSAGISGYATGTGGVGVDGAISGASSGYGNAGVRGRVLAGSDGYGIFGWSQTDNGTAVVGLGWTDDKGAFNFTVDTPGTDNNNTVVPIGYFRREANSGTPAAGIGTELIWNIHNAAKEDDLVVARLRHYLSTVTADAEVSVAEFITLEGGAEMIPLKLRGGYVNLPTVLSYADVTAALAAGLVAGDVYMASGDNATFAAGILMIVH